MEHVRSDEGIKRGPRKPRKKPGPKPSSVRRLNGQFVEKLPNDPAAIQAAIESYQHGATLEQIAQQHSVTRQAVYGWLLGGMGDEHHADLVTRALTARVANADALLEEGDNPLDTTRGDRMARWARQDLERRRPALYGQKQQIDHNVVVVHIEAELGSIAGSLVERIRGNAIDSHPEGDIVEDGNQLQVKP